MSSAIVSSMCLPEGVMPVLLSTGPVDGIPSIENPSILELNSLTDTIMRYIMAVNSSTSYCPSNSLDIRGNADV